MATVKTPKPKNLCGKTRGLKAGEKPYEVWEGGGFKYEVLKKYQGDDQQQYARAFCRTTSPYTYGVGELGDCYIADYKRGTVMTEKNY